MPDSCHARLALSRAMGRAQASATATALAWRSRESAGTSPASVPEEENLGHRSSLRTSTSDAAKETNWQEKGEKTGLKATGGWGKVTQG